jgi:hypothetical protein
MIVKMTTTSVTIERTINFATLTTGMSCMIVPSKDVRANPLGHAWDAVSVDESSIGMWLYRHNQMEA